MVKVYITQIKMGKMPIETVPEKWRAEVRKELGDVTDTKEADS